MIPYKTIHWWISIVVALGLWTACGTDSPPDDTRIRDDNKNPESPDNTTPDDGESYENYKPGDEVKIRPLSPDDPREVIPCTGDLCYDITDPDVAAGIQKFIDVFLAGADLENLTEHEFRILMAFQKASDAYSACNYERVDDEIIVANCPTWVGDLGLKGCPGHFFSIKDPHDNAVVPVSGKSTRYYCVKVDDRMEEDGLSCPNGLVNVGRIGGEWIDRAANDYPQCIGAEPCEKIADLEGIHGEDVCFYGDYSKVSTGVIPEQDCSALAPGTCAINCPCASTSTGFVSLDNDCHFLSEERSIGVCGDQTCSGKNPWCISPKAGCAVFNWPTWIANMDADGTYPFAEPGICAVPSGCMQWAEEHPGLMTCHPAQLD